MVYVNLLEGVYIYICIRSLLRQPARISRLQWMCFYIDKVCRLIWMAAVGQGTSRGEKTGGSLGVPSRLQITSPWRFRVPSHEVPGSWSGPSHDGCILCIDSRIFAAWHLCPLLPAFMPPSHQFLLFGGPICRNMVKDQICACWWNPVDASGILI